MKRATGICALVCMWLLPGCMFEKPVFTSGFSPLPEAMAGVWVSAGEGGDPRKDQFAVFAPLSGDSWLLAYPAGLSDDATYYEVQGRQVAPGRHLLQLRTIASFGEGVPDAGAKRYSLILLDEAAAGTVRVRLIEQNGPLKGKTAEEAAAILGAPDADFDAIFGDDPMDFRLLK